MFSDFQTLPKRFPNDITYREIGFTPSLIRCDLDTVRDIGGDYLNNIIDQVIDLDLIPTENIRVSSSAQRLANAAFPTTPGWHHDWYTTTGWANDGSEDITDRPFILLFWVGNVAPTEFYVGQCPPEWDVQLPTETKDVFWKRRHDDINDSIRSGHGKVVVTQPGVLYKMDHTSVHRPTPAEFLGYRLLVRIEHSSRPADNRINRNITSYLPIDLYHKDHMS